MKKGFRGTGTVERVDFPNKGIAVTDDGDRVIVKNTIPGQKVEFVVNKVKHQRAEGRLMEVIEKSPLETEEPCPHFGMCGGCTYQTVPYEKQLDMKLTQVKKLISDAIGTEKESGYEFIGIHGSPKKSEYRNKMEFSFGDEYKDGPLAIGMHKRGSFYDLVTVSDCQIVDEDFRTILKATLDYFSKNNIPYFHRATHKGYLRHLLVRKATKTGEIIVDLVTSTQTEGFNEEELLAGFRYELLTRHYDGRFKGVLHTKNDSVADVVKNEGTEVLYGDSYFYEELLGLKFKITPFSFFQTNSLGAEVLYETAREFILGDDKDSLNGKTVYDLYSGTGTIAQLMAPVCKEVVGVEIVEEAVCAAKENAALNGLDNCKFIAGDVLKVLDEIEEKPDYDGEERILVMELALDTHIRIWKEEKIRLLTDLYSLQKEVKPVFRECPLERLLVKNAAKCRMTEQMELKEDKEKVLQICSCEGKVLLERQEIKPDGVLAEGTVEVNILYITPDDHMPVGAVQEIYPFSQLVEIPEMSAQAKVELDASLEQLSAVMLDQEHVEIRAAVRLDLIAFVQEVIQNIEEATESEPDLEMLRNRPGLVGYIAKAGDDLWTIARENHTTIQNIMETNHRKSEVLLAGEKVLIVKQVG